MYLKFVRPITVSSFSIKRLRKQCYKKLFYKKKRVFSYHCVCFMVVYESINKYTDFFSLCIILSTFRKHVLFAWSRANFNSQHLFTHIYAHVYNK